MVSILQNSLYILLGVAVAIFADLILYRWNYKTRIKNDKEILIRKELQDLFQNFYDSEEIVGVYKVTPTMKNMEKNRQDYFSEYVRLNMYIIIYQIYFDKDEELELILKVYIDNYNESLLTKNDVTGTSTLDDRKKFHKKYIMVQAGKLDTFCLQAMKNIKDRLNKLS